MIRSASYTDIPGLETLINLAYRGEASRAGWTTEADMISGTIRTDAGHLGQILKNPGSVILVSEEQPGIFEGCVYLDKQEDKLYLGMLSVHPNRQERGTGKILMAASEKYALENGCRSIFMRVISLRTELIAWYQRQGYHPTGKREPFLNGPYGDARMPFDFIILEKTCSAL